MRLIDKKKWLLPAALLATASICFSQGHSPRNYWHNEPRQVRYHPDGASFVIKNGDKRFTRAIYGTNTGFRFETSDYPEFGLYMPNLGGSVYLALTNADTALWVKDVQSDESRFVSGKRIYTLKDSRLLGKGSIQITAIALSDADGFIVKTEATNLPKGLKLVWVYGGASDKRFSRSGDIGADPADCFYLTPDKCTGNQFDIQKNVFTVNYGKAAKQITGVFPVGTHLRTADGKEIPHLQKLLNAQASDTPVLLAEQPARNGVTFCEWHNPLSHASFRYNQLAEAFVKGENFRASIANRVKVNTPDPFLNTLGGILAGAEDAIWESPSYLHGAIGWRVPLTGWRGSYLADVLGLHDRARTHFNGYAKSQVTHVPATLPHTQDTASNLSRAAKIWGTPMYSNGYISRYPNKANDMNHYDMNLVYIDELLWHLNWTGDWNYAKEIFPVIKRHLAWEKLVFDPDNDGLYDGYCCIWASDGLQYDGGVATHSTAYNYRANKMAADIAAKIGEDPSPYQKEADLILKKLNSTLWLKDKGWWAEFKDNMGHKMAHEDAAVWTVYHTIDSEANDPFQAYQASRYVDTHIPHIPVLAENLKDTTNYVISTSDWQPYNWSINNVAFAEIAHTALAFWQAGRSDEAFKMYKGALLDAMYLGSGPGNITQISFYDAARGETYRDFADPVATAARALVHGLFGIYPDLLHDKLTIRPGFPADWKYASLETQNICVKFNRNQDADTWQIVPKLPKTSSLTLELNARKDELKSVLVNGKKCPWTLADNAISLPKVVIEAGAANTYEIVVVWAGNPISNTLQTFRVARGDRFNTVFKNKAAKLYDPQSVLDQATLNDSVLTGLVKGEVGHRTVFVQVKQGSRMVWWKPLDLNVHEPIEILSDSESRNLRFKLINRSKDSVEGDLFINDVPQGVKVTLGMNSKRWFTYGPDMTRLGTNKITLKTPSKTYAFKTINWTLPNPAGLMFEKIDLTPYFNDRVRDIYAYGKYLNPRWPYTTLQVPTQGMGEWCHPEDLSKIDDRGLRTQAAQGTVSDKMGDANSRKGFADKQMITIKGIPFATPGDSTSKNVVFTTLWDNYPEAVTIPLSGKASKVYLLVAASTYHMQSHILNGSVTVTYTDGTSDVLNLVLPENLLPLDQDLYTDGYAFTSKEPRPYRIRLKTGDVSRNHAADLGMKQGNGPLLIDGGLATMLDLPLNPDKTLATLSVKTIANEVIIGLMSATLVRN
jgi:hypothetical protein